MRNVLFIAMAAITLGGCANSQYRNIPHPPITQEQDTPFVFKERYQTVATELTTVRIEHQSDFVKIQSTDEIVFWAPRSLVQNLSPAATLSIHDEADASVKKENSDTPDKKLTSDKDINVIPASFSPPALDTDKQSSSQCKPIVCDGHVCGDIAVCGDKPCDPSLHDTYACSDETCNLMVTHPSEIAKGEGECGVFAQLYTCPIATKCKAQRRLVRGNNHESE